MSLVEYRKLGTFEKQIELQKKEKNEKFGTIALEITSFAPPEGSVSTAEKKKSSSRSNLSENNNNNNESEDSKRRKKRREKMIPHSYSTVGFEVAKEKKKKEKKEKKRERERKGRRKKSTKRKEEENEKEKTPVKTKGKYLRSQSFDHSVGQAGSDEGVDFITMMKKKVQEQMDLEKKKKEGELKENNNNNNNNSSVSVVKLAPPSDTNKLFGVALAVTMEKQKESYPDLLVPAFFVDAARIIHNSKANGIFLFF